jgi:pimeloyl-ACP methyl ester carboxylesterase
MIAADETFDGTWPYRPHFFDGNGFRQHYVDEGSTDGKNDNVIVCVHGQPTWGYLYRNFIPSLTKLGRVIVPDHMGFGKSETPQEKAYSIREHTDNLEDLLKSLDVKNITLVVQDWGGPIGSSFAMRNPDLIKCICYCNGNVPWARVPTGPMPEFKWLNWVNSEQYEPTISNLGSTVLSVMKRIEKLQAIPAMCVVGDEDRTTPADIRVFGFQSMWPNGPVIRLPGVGHFLQEDAPEAVSALVSQFIQMNNPPGAVFNEPSREWNESSKWALAPDG